MSNSSNLTHIPMALLKILERAYLLDPTGTRQDLDWLANAEEWTSDGELKIRPEDLGFASTLIGTSHQCNNFKYLDEDCLMFLDAIEERLRKLAEAKERGIKAEEPEKKYSHLNILGVTELKPFIPSKIAELNSSRPLPGGAEMGRSLRIPHDGMTDEEVVTQIVEDLDLSSSIGSDESAVVVHLTPSTQERLDKYMRANRFNSYEAAIKHCILQTLESWEKQNVEL